MTWLRRWWRRRARNDALAATTQQTTASFADTVTRLERALEEGERIHAGTGGQDAGGR